MRKANLSLVLLAASILSSLWLLSCRFLAAWLSGLLTEGQWLAFLLSAACTFLLVTTWSVAQLLRRPAAPRRQAQLPALFSAVTVLLLAVPMPFLWSLDFRAQYEARAEVVRRIDGGELWNGSPMISVVALPWERYPRSVSNGADMRSIVVYREDGALHVVFYPTLPPGLLEPRSAVMYRSDGRPPVLPNGYLPQASSSERLDGNWHRIIF